jgi:hypothetical protein
MSPFLLVDIGTNAMNQTVSDTTTGDFTQTPEPATLGMVGLGILAAAMPRMKARKHA